jgi:multiple sugar transport system permease protein
VRATVGFTHWVDRHAGLLLGLPALGVLALFAYYPVVGSVWLSLHRVVLSLPGTGEPFVGLANYAELIQNPVFWNSLGVTLVFVVVSTALELLLGLGLALCLHASYRSRGLVRAAALVPWAIPTVVASQMWRFLLNDRFGPVSFYLLGGAAPLADPNGALASVITADIWKTTSFVGLVLLAGLQVIPDELHEAAEVDGAGGGPADATNVLQYLGYKRMFAEGFLGSGAAISSVVFVLTLVVSIAYIRVVGSRLWEGERA